MKNILTLIAGAALLAFASTAATALPITGTLDFSGGATLDSSNLTSATQVVSFQNVVVSSGGVTPGSALDSTINPGDPVTMNFPWLFNSGIANLWVVGGFTFNLNTSAIAFQSVDFLSVKGTGIITGNGFDATAATWYFSTQGPGINTSYSISATTVSTGQAVPDAGTTVLLLGSALIVAGIASRMRKITV